MRIKTGAVFYTVFYSNFQCEIIPNSEFRIPNLTLRIDKKLQPYHCEGDIEGIGGDGADDRCYNLDFGADGRLFLCAFYI